MSTKHRKKKKHAATAGGAATNRLAAGGVAGFFAQFLMPAGGAPAEPVWRLLPLVLFAAFVLRAAVALAGDFVIHPDEIMQYLEPAHQLVFGSGVSYWEYYFGARSWLVPGFVAAILQLCAWLGLDSPPLYIGAVKLAFCAVSLLIPYGMYVAGRHLFGEQVGRTALVLGAFWYELVGFAHKPMTEFVATSLLFLLFALVVRPPSPHLLRRAVCAVAVGVLLVAVRFHYAPLAGLVLLAGFLRSGNVVRGGMVVTAVVCFAAVGVFEYLTWGNFFHSYLVNFQANIYMSDIRGDESSAWNYIGWPLLASGGVFLAASVVFLDWRRRHLWVLALLVAVLLPHMWESHREYRFIFATVPLFLLLFADVLTNGFGRRHKLAQSRWWKIAGLSYAGVVSLLGIFNAIPYQHLAYIGYSAESGYVGFLRNQDPMFAVYRQLAADSSVKGILDSRRAYFNTGGYYYLHKNIPFYDAGLWRAIFSLDEAGDYASHIITAAPVTPEGVVQTEDGRLAMRVKDGDGEENYVGLPRLINDASLNKLVYWNAAGEATPLDDFAPAGGEGEISVWALTTAAPMVREWESYNIAADSEVMYPVIKKATSIKIREPLPNGGIKIK